MAVITGYASLQTAVADWLAKSNLTTFIPNFIQNWEEKLYRQPKNFGRWMETDLSSVIAASVIALPSDYLGLKYAYVNGSPSTPLDRKSIQQLYGKFPRGMATDRPIWIARDAGNFVFGPPPDSTYTIKGIYWAKPVLMRSFAADAAAHWIIVNAPDLALYGALCESAPFLRSDARLPMWKELYGEALKDYRDMHSEEDISGSPSQEVLA